jgi:membrane protease YdiL (CAAX protease family)
VSINRRSLLAFFGLAYALSWTLWLVAIAGTEGTGATIAELAALAGPTAAAAIVAWRVGWIREWVAGILRWRVPIRWWAVTLVLPLAHLVAMHVGLVLTGNDAVDLSLLPAQAISYLPALVVTTIAMGGLNEEPGWRGFALPHLQQRFSPVRATLVLGTAWAIWHLPTFAFPAAREGLEVAEVGMLVGGALIEVVAWAFIFTWLYNNTNSTLLCILLHGGINAATASLLLPPDALQGGAYLQVALTGNATVLAAAVALVLLTRGRLGQPPVRLATAGP